VSIADIDDLRTPEGDLDPLRISEDLRVHGLRAVELKHAYQAFLQSKGATLARLRLTMSERYPNETRKEAQDRAEASDEWQDFIHSMNDAEREYRTAQVLFQVALARFEAMRTAEATRRAEMNNWRR
jgi:hypothetical protein